MFQHKLDKKNPIPLYHQLKQVLKGMIETKELEPGDTFWTDEELSHMYSVSRTTVREAVRVLVREGFLVVEQGKRTCVAKPKITRGFLGLTSFTEDMTKKGLVPGYRVVAFNITEPPPEITEKLKIDNNQRVVQLKRQMFANGELIGYHITHLPYHVWEKLEVEPDFFNNNSLYQTLEGKAGITLVDADESIEVGYADKETAKMLLVRKGDPLLMMTKVVYDENGIPVECVTTIYRPDRYKYEIHHRRQKYNKLP
jgi:GntR family transcriptional regulator